MRPLQKSYNIQSSRIGDLHKSSNITKIEHERRERGFQVFISGANKDRLKLQDVQQEVEQTKKAQKHNNPASARKPKPSNIIPRRKFWHKSPDIKIKGSKNSKFSLQNQKPSKPDTIVHGSILHDITSKTIDSIHPSSRKNSQLNLIRNRYKAYFHIDGYGFCCSKDPTKPLTPAKYQIDGTSPILGQNSSKQLKRTQNKRSVSTSFTPKPCDTAAHQSQYDSLLNQNHERVCKLQEYLTPDYEYFKNAKESDSIQDLCEGIAKEEIPRELCDGIVYNVFYHNEQNIRKSLWAPCSGNKEFSQDVFFDNQTCAKAILPIEKQEISGNGNEVEDVFYEDERALVLLDNEGNLNDALQDDNGNKNIDGLPPLGKARSPIVKLGQAKGNHFHNVFLNSSNNKLLKEGISINDQKSASKIVDISRGNLLKLNLRYLQQDPNFKVLDTTNLNTDQSYDGHETSTSFNDTGSSGTLEHSMINSSNMCNNDFSPKWTSNHEQRYLQSLLEEQSICKENFHGLLGDNHNKSELSCLEMICSNQDIKQEKTILKLDKSMPRLRGKLLSARVQKLDMKKQIYLSHILDKLEIAQVTNSLDLLSQLDPQSLSGLEIEETLHV